MSWKNILKSDSKIREYIERITIDDMSDAQFDFPYDAIISNNPLSHGYADEHPENGLFALEAYGGYELGTWSVIYYKNGEEVYPIPLQKLLNLVGMTRKEILKEIEEDD